MEPNFAPRPAEPNPAPGPPAAARVAPEFLGPLATDHPGIARNIAAEIPRWCTDVDRLVGREGTGEALLRQLRYFSANETDRYIQGVANEATAALMRDKHASVAFITFSASGSGQYFFERCTSRIPEQLRDRVSLRPAESSGMLQDRYAKRNVDYFVLDDAANSGEQLKYLLYCPKHVTTMYQPPTFRLPWSREAPPQQFHLRIMAMTEHAEEQVLKVECAQLERFPRLVTVDSRHVRMPIVGDVLQQLGIDPTKLSPEARKAFSAVKDPPILGFFSHRMQDNLPYILAHPGAGVSNLPEPLFGPGRWIEKSYGPREWT